MSYLVLARKWRPQSLQDLIGQEHVGRTLSNAIASDRVHHAFLFTGARGVGKTSAARILAKALNCKEGMGGDPCQVCASCVAITAGNDVDVIEIDGASNTGVDDVRELRENVRYLPARARYKVFIIDEVHMLSINAFNALLKTLEEPPPHAKFILATTEPHKIPITIHSRCQRFDFRKIGMQMMTDHLRKILDAEGITISDQAIALVARRGEGSMRDSLSTLDQVLAFCGNTVEDDEVESLLGLVDKHLLSSMAEAVLDRDSYRVLDTVRRVDTLGYSYRQVVRELIEFFRILVVLKATDQGDTFLDITPDQQKEASRLADIASADDLQRLVMILIKAEPEFRSSPFPRLALEMILLRLAKLPESRDVGNLLARLDGLKPTGSSGGENRSRTSGSASGASASAYRDSSESRQSEPSRSAAPHRDGVAKQVAPVQDVSDRFPTEEPVLDPKTEPRAEQAASDPYTESLISSGGPSAYQASAPQPPAQEYAPPATSAQTVSNPVDTSSEITNQAPADNAEIPIVAEGGDNQSWKSFVQFVISKKRVLGSSLEHAHLEKFALPDIEIGYPRSASFNSELVQDRENYDLLLNMGKEFFSREIKIKIKEVSVENAPAPSLVEERNAKAADKKKTCEDEVRGNSLVQSVVDTFTGKIITITPHSGQKVETSI